MCVCCAEHSAASIKLYIFRELHAQIVFGYFVKLNDSTVYGSEHKVDTDELAYRQRAILAHSPYSPYVVCTDVNKQFNKFQFNHLG